MTDFCWEVSWRKCLLFCSFAYSTGVNFSLQPFHGLLATVWLHFLLRLLLKYEVQIEVHPVILSAKSWSWDHEYSYIDFITPSALQAWDVCKQSLQLISTQNDLCVTFLKFPLDALLVFAIVCLGEQVREVYPHLFQKSVPVCRKLGFPEVMMPGKGCSMCHNSRLDVCLGWL